MITSKGNFNGRGILGQAWVGTTCRNDKYWRVNLNKYGAITRNKVIYAAEIVAHEIGHNLNMKHDFGRKDSSGRTCQGYMDYTPATKGWSGCNVEDVRQLGKGCLQKINGDSCEDLKDWCKYKPDCLNEEVKKQCPKLCGICGTDTGGPDTDGPNQPCQNQPGYPYCVERFKWACRSERHAWFRDTCKKLCGC